MQSWIWIPQTLKKLFFNPQKGTYKWGTFYLFIATQIIGGAKELVVLFWLSSDFQYKQGTKRVGLPLRAFYLLIANFFAT